MSFHVFPKITIKLHVKVSLKDQTDNLFYVHRNENEIV